MVLNNFIWSVSDMPPELNYAVYLSYEDLSPCVKQCFLYYSLLPKGAWFHRDRVISMWISAGFVHGTSDELEDCGKNHYKELILRNLIDPCILDQSICTMHDIVRSFAQFVARDEALAVNSKETDIINKLSAQKFLRLSVESLKSDGLDWSSLQKQKTLRTLISVGDINMKPGDSCVGFPSLRTLNMENANSVSFVESLYQLKHLRYLSIENSDISGLPDNIGNLKFLHFISVSRCKQFVRLPPSIVGLRQLRYLDIRGTAVNVIPRGFCALTNLRTLLGFPAQEDGDWCSFEELSPLCELRTLCLKQLENVSGTLSAAKLKLAEKVHLTELFLTCSKLVNNGVLNGVEHQRIEEVFDELCPPACLDFLSIHGYFGQRFPRWVMSSSDVPLKNLRVLCIVDLACCTQLPDGLCKIPCLEHFRIEHAPSIKRVGPEFLQPCYHLAPATAMFPRLHTMMLNGMVNWEEWEWEEQVEAFPFLEKLVVEKCKLRRLPPGLALHARALKKIFLSYVPIIKSLEKFTSLVELNLYYNQQLEKISDLPNLQKLTIVGCGMLKVLEGVPALQRLVLNDCIMETLPEYMRGIKPKHFLLFCRPWLVALMAKGESDPEWEKFSHVEDVKAYARNEDNRVEGYVVYTRDPCNLKTNIRRATAYRGKINIESSSCLNIILLVWFISFLSYI
jgi:Leucine-rich repeat (LRR) protein